MVLTAAGEALIGPARQALRDVETGGRQWRRWSGWSGEPLSLGCLPTLAADPMAGLIGRFRQDHPGVRIDLAAPEDTADLVDLLRSGRCELGIAGSDDRPKRSRGSGRGRAAPAGHPPTRRRRSGWRQALGGLEGVPLVATPEGTSSRRLLEEGFADAGATPSVAVVTAQRDAILPLVLAGAGSALVPERLAEVAALLGAVVGHPDPPITRQVALLYRPGPLAPAAQRFVGLAR